MTFSDVHEAVKAGLGPQFLNETIPGTARWKRAPYQATLRASVRPGTKAERAGVELVLREFGRKDRTIELGVGENLVVEKLIKAITKHLNGPREIVSDPNA
jgi:hypothetical protein